MPKHIPRIPGTFGAWITEQRKARQWTMAELADRAKISTSWLSALEKNISPSEVKSGNPKPSTAVIDAVCDAFGTDADEWRMKFGYLFRYISAEMQDTENYLPMIMAEKNTGQLRIIGTPPVEAEIQQTVSQLRQDADRHASAAAKLRGMADMLERAGV